MTIPRLSLVAITLGLTACSPPPPPIAFPEITIDQCEAAWNQSKASETCHAEFSIVGGYDCRANYTCLTPDGGARTSWMIGGTSTLHHLNNCDGTLKPTCIHRVP